MSAVLSGWIGAVVTLALVAFAERTQRSATKLPDGWRALRPGWLIHCVMVLCIGFAGLISYFLLRGGSGRPDAFTQNLFACLLLAVAVGGAAYIGWTSYFRTIIWKGNELRVRRFLAPQIVRRFSDVTQITIGAMRGEYRVTFRDGSRFWFSEHMHGAKDLTARLPRRAFSD